MIRIAVLFSFCLMFFSLEAKYVVKGKVNLGEEWQPTVFMAAVHKLNDYYRTSSKLVINTAVVDEEGNFLLEGNNLPDEDLFYRLYLMKNENTEFDACLYVGGHDFNSVHLILNNDSEVEVTADSSSLAPFGNYSVEGGNDNLLMRELSSIVFPSFYFYKIQFPLELRLSEEKLHSDLKSFSDTCGNTLVALAAVNNMDFDSFFEKNKDFYLDFQKRVNADLPNTAYAQNFNRKIDYYNGSNSHQSQIWKCISAILALLLILMTAFWMKTKKAANDFNQTKLESKLDPRERLTKKELEILTCIQSGKSNKEIASELIVEVSTVKSHINKIYSKLEVSNRSELINALKA